MSCFVCGEKAEIFSVGSTLVGYVSPPGHNHNDNCIAVRMKCVNGHESTAIVRNRCLAPGCDWVGKERCFCHTGIKVFVPEFDAVRSKWRC